MNKRILIFLLAIGLTITPIFATPESTPTQPIWTEQQIKAAVNFAIATGTELTPHAINAILFTKNFALTNPYTCILTGGIGLGTIAYRNRKKITDNFDIKDFIRKNWKIIPETLFVAGSIWGSGKLSTHLISQTTSNGRDYSYAWGPSFMALLGVTAAPVGYKALNRIANNLPTKPLDSMIKKIEYQDNNTIGELNPEIDEFIQKNNGNPPMLLYGETGTGKTTNALLIAKKRKKTIYIVDASSFSSSYLNGVAGNINKVVFFY